MNIILKRADIVILASNHNPSIISPEWLKENELILETPLYSIQTPDFSFYDSQTYSLIIDRQRLQITLKKQDIKSLLKLSNIEARYVELSPFIPYNSLGINFVWIAEFDANESIPKIHISINSAVNLETIFKDHDLNFGYLIFASKNLIF